MAFGDIGGRRTVKVCCGPRCGAEPGHRAVYRAVEAAVADPVVPTLCQGLCGYGVTVVLPDGDKRKIRDAREARDIL
jgi:hypothetical protein